MLREFLLTNILEAGIDEAGRGCLAGPVTCAAVILRTAYPNNEIAHHSALHLLAEQLNDSKKLSVNTREKLKQIIEKVAISFAVVHISPQKIDEINILQASIFGMQQAVLKLNCKPDHVIVDGNRFNSGNFLSKNNRNLFFDYNGIAENENFCVIKNKIQYTTIIKGDEKFQSIAAASILAKTYRDLYMDKVDKEFPMYNWKQNKGYPTREHKLAIQKYGLTKYHRITFRSEL